MDGERILVLHNEPVLAGDHPDVLSEQEVVETAESVVKHLAEARFDVERLAVSRDPGALVAALSEIRPAAVFNLFEGTGDDGGSEACAAGILEWLGIPFTGSPSQTLSLARDKCLTKHLLRGARLPTPDFFVVERLPTPACPLPFPVIVKPALQDASIGVDQGSVVTDQAQLERRVGHVLDTYGPPVLIEQFILGRELGVALIETPDLRALPVWEITFVDKTPGYWPIVTYDAKWKPGSPDYELTPPRNPADVTPKLAERLTALAMKAHHLLGCRDYGRVDFRVRPNGRPYILEVNPNPCLHADAGLAGGLPCIGMTHGQLMVQLIRNALARGRSAHHVAAPVEIKAL
jgi:D-alanine-D-alanine ligase